MRAKIDIKNKKAWACTFMICLLALGARQVFSQSAEPELIWEFDPSSVYAGMESKTLGDYVASDTEGIFELTSDILVGSFSGSDAAVHLIEPGGNIKWSSSMYSAVGIRLVQSLGDVNSDLINDVVAVFTESSQMATVRALDGVDGSEIWAVTERMPVMAKQTPHLANHDIDQDGMIDFVVSDGEASTRAYSAGKFSTIVPNQLPIPIIKVRSISRSGKVRLTGRQSYDPEGEPLGCNLFGNHPVTGEPRIIAYAWDFGEGANQGYWNVFAKSPTVYYSCGGPKTITLRVVDNQCGISEPPATINLNLLGAPCP